MLSIPIFPPSKPRVPVNQEEERELLDEFTSVRLVYAEGGRYLALGLPWR
jgi:hypothetical protein